MSIYQQLLYYYLSSNVYYDHFKQYFFDLYDHCGECSESALPYLYGEKVNRYPFCSEIYLTLKKTDPYEQERRITARLTGKRIHNYFTKNFDESQLFAVIFSYANELSDKQIAQIANLRHQKTCWDILNFFLINRDAELYQPELPLRPIKYFVTKDRDYEAQREGNKLTLRESGEVLEIL